MQIAWIFTVRDRLITRIEAFADREEALEAAGLRE
jgi:ketosteroid isomerase-like protein